MSCHTGSNLVRSGLILHLDAASINSRKNSRSLINWDSWAVGTGGVTGYALNGDGNSRILDTNPWGLTDVIWDVTNQDATSDADGGFDGTTFLIDNTKMYRFSIWMKRKVVGGGYYYLGTNGLTSAGASVGVNNRASGALNTNPYFFAATWGVNANEWYLLVGHVWPVGSGTGAVHVDTGVYNTSGVKLGSGNDYVWIPTSIRTNLRSYLYYSTDITTNQQFYQPRVDLCDGSEPTVKELISSNGNGILLKDLSGYDNHHLLINRPVFDSGNSGRFGFNGTDQGIRRASQLNGLADYCTVVLWYSTTDSQELWVMGQTGSYYLSASSGNNYYHSNVGGPTNYVDLKTVVNPVTEGYRNGQFHMWEAKNLSFSTWTEYNWFLYPSSWYMLGNASAILVYNRILTAEESRQNFAALKSRYSM